MPNPEKKSKPKRAKSGSTDKDAGPVISYMKKNAEQPANLFLRIVPADPRFANIQSDPRYRLPSKRHTHVKLDKRFAHMLRDEDFSKTAAVDRYGRKLRRDDTKKQLERFYRLDEGDEDEDDKDDNMSVEEDDVVQKELRKADKRDYDPARDGGFSDSSSEESSSEEEEEEEDDVEDDAEEVQFPQQQQADVPLGDVSRRIAVVNLDWDNIRAEDLMAVFSSFLPPGGSIKKVSVYPSEFGRERMEREEMEGPPKEIFARKKGEESDEGGSSEEDEEEEEEKIKQSIIKEDQGDEFDSAHLRKYQLERLRYFYAVLTCSSESVAKHIYDAVDGTEYMSSANFFDLRFVPDETDFSDDTPRDECERIPDGYKPSDFVTDALQHSKVKLTWDADDASRKEAQARAFKGGRKEIDENDLKAYLGSDSSDDEDDEEGGVEVVDSTAGEGAAAPPVKLSKKEAARERMRALLGLSQDKPAAESKSKGPVGDMEITFSAGLSTGASKGNVFENEPEKEETTAEKYIRKERERKARRKARMKAARNGEPLPDEGDGGEKKAPDAEKGEKNDDLGFDDPFFTAPEQDAAAATARRKEERRKKREEREADEAAAAAKRAELELLMVDDKTSNVKHFDMKDIEKAEKRARKAGKNKTGKKGEDVEMPQDDFKMDVKDERFQRLWDNHEFAIDPSNPRFKATQGMKALLEEGRKRRRNKDDGVVDREVPEPGKKRRKGGPQAPEGVAAAEDLNKLVERVKGKTKRVGS
ncbi:hypothetical protein AJ79_07490 [Helicocarpus griseus UAMH5409]|uniref:Uncharacterized protein n=1 Tax=Helicocarpus griseus UAMH5409 TaxID=1447875 RepID=A0A2B7X2D2_9EURO|nr:hypothetical protein AJ79_07490 [Helicocarpus griseus UAMH5409]